MEALPIFKIRDGFTDALRRTNRIVLTAPTGSGKSTQTPQFLLDAPPGMLAAGQILVLQPRRLAARMLAERVAEERGGRLGDEVGFQTRFETAVSAQTRLRFITEGILPRMLLGDPLLRTVAAVVFDEFHERSLATDLSLALIRSLQETRRPDLKLVVMSATLDAARLMEYLGADGQSGLDGPNGHGRKNSPPSAFSPQPSAPLHLHAEGRRYPVEIRYRKGGPGNAQPWELAADALGDLLAEGAAGDVLVFMPGSYEIRRTMEACRRHAGAGTTLLPLYGDLPAEQQHQVMRPDPARRKIIIATNIAETSLTIPGVRHVIDSGLARIQRFDAARGFNTLFVEPVSRAAADQRAGRAGREGPGICLRLWTQLEQNHRPAHQDAEIARVDLAETVLNLSMLGFQPHEFPWFEPPPTAAIEAATALLSDLGALSTIANGEVQMTSAKETPAPPASVDFPNSSFGIRNSPFAIPFSVTPLGRRMSQLPAHPRLARLLLEASERGCLREATLLAAILSERNALLAAKTEDAPAEDPHDSDLNRLMTLLHQARAAHYDPAFCTRLGVNATAARQVFRTQAYFHQVCHRNGLHDAPEHEHAVELAKSLLLAYPDHLARRRDQGTLVCELRNGRRAELAKTSAARHAPLIVAAEIRETGGRGQAAKTTLSLAAAVREEWLDELFPDSRRTETDLEWNVPQQLVEKRIRSTHLGVVMEEKVLPGHDEPGAGALLARMIRDRGLHLAGWNEHVEAWIARVRWVAEQFPERGLITYDEGDRELLLGELCDGEWRYAKVREKPVLGLAKGLLSYDDQQFVERMAPETLPLPTGRKMRLKYTPGQPPHGSARIADLYDLKSTPKVAGGRATVLLEILAPNNRPVQITDDLAGFWERHYPNVKKTLARKYPRHEWR